MPIPSLRMKSFLSIAVGTLALAACSSMGGGSGGGTGGGGASSMGFFVTSTPLGRGGDLGGLIGADRQCQALAAAAGSQRIWRAYLSAAPTGGQPAVHARDRIGKGPWRNARGDVVAKDLDDLHGPNVNVNEQTVLTEKGQPVNGRGDTPNEHDILTGSTADGRLDTSAPDTTCRNWTSSTDGSAIVGHHDRTGTNPDPVRNISWNASHGTRGCSVEGLKATGGAGRFYCFAAN